MKASLQEKFNPPSVQQPKSFSDAPVKNASQAKDSTDPEKADFRDLLMNSNRDVKESRDAQKVGDNDLAGAKTQEEFLQKLAEKTNKGQRTPKNTMDKDDFLKLFVTQLQQQDPFQPKDSSEMASQMAQFNSLEQMMNINKSLDNMAKAQGSAKNMGLVDYVGKELTIRGGRMKLENGAVSNASFVVEHPTTEAQLQVRDGSGQVVFEDQLGALKPGEHNVEWNGKSKTGKDLPSGVYAYSIISKGSDGKEVKIDTNTRVRVTGVDVAGDGSFFTDLGKFRPEDIQAVGSAGFKRYVEEAMVKPEKGAVDGKVAALDPKAAGADKKPHSVQEAAEQMIASMKNGEAPGPMEPMPPQELPASAPVEPAVVAEPAKASTLKIVDKPQAGLPRPATNMVPGPGPSVM